MLKDLEIRRAFCAILRDEIAVGWKERGPVSCIPRFSMYGALYR